MLSPPEPEIIKILFRNPLMLLSPMTKNFVKLTMIIMIHPPLLHRHLHLHPDQIRMNIPILFSIRIFRRRNPDRIRIIRKKKNQNQTPETEMMKKKYPIHKKLKKKKSRQIKKSHLNENCCIYKKQKTSFKKKTCWHF